MSRLKELRAYVDKKLNKIDDEDNIALIKAFKKQKSY